MTTRRPPPSSSRATHAISARYAQSTDGDRTLGVTFTLDAPTVADDVLVFDATLDLAAGVLAGGVFTGRAEIGARGAGPMKRAGRFDATLR